jgi:hypothetical protein
LLELFPLSMNLRTVSLLYIYIFMPAAVLFFALQKMFLKKVAGDQLCQPKRRNKRRLICLDAKSKFIVSVVVLATLSIGGLLFSFDMNRKNALEMNSFLRQERWDDYLKAAEKFEEHNSYNVQVNHDINRSLYHVGRLGDEMFAHKQSLDAMFLLNSGELDFATQYLRVVDIFYEIGNINMAEKWAYEILELEGPSPPILRRLSDIHIVKSQIPSAKVFLHALSKDLIHGQYARQRLEQLETDPELKSDRQVQLLRSLKWQDNGLYRDLTMETMLLGLLKQNPKNRMVYEYLMGGYLMSNNLEKFIENLYRLDEMGYERIPSHYEEAILIYRMSTNRTVSLNGRQISKASLDRSQDFLRALKPYRLNKKAAMAALAPEFGNSYFFYRMFNVSGAGQ